MIAVFVLLGLMVGSFLNVLVLRLNTGRPIAVGRSACLSCSHVLGWLELIPVVSYVLQGGRCKHCGVRLSSQYPIVEASTALSFGLIAFVYAGNDFWQIILYSVIACTLIAIAAYDLRHSIIPDQLVYAFVALSILGHFIVFRAFDVASYDLWAGPIFFAVFASLWLLSKGTWMGFGDAKLVLGIGLLLGLRSGMAALLLAFWMGALVGIALLLGGRRGITMKSEIPFAPFLVLGTLIVMIFNIQLF